MTDAVADARCAVHRDRPAIGICDRCGAFACETCLAPTGAGPQCAACRDADGPGALDAFVAARQGRRDALAWGIGVAGIVFWSWEVVGIAGVRFVFHTWNRPLWSFWVGIGMSVAGLVLHGAYLARARWSRWAIAFPIVVLSLVEAIRLVRVGLAAGFEPIFVLCLSVGCLALVAHAWRSPLNRLAFGLDVPREDLAVAWKAVRRNRLAYLALVLSIPVALVPFFYIPVIPVVVTAWKRSRLRGGRLGWVALVAAVFCLAGFAVTALEFVHWTSPQR